MRLQCPYDVHETLVFSVTERQIQTLLEVVVEALLNCALGVTLHSKSALAKFELAVGAHCLLTKMEI